MSSPEREDFFERRLRDQALRPVDAAFTHRVLAALPRRKQHLLVPLQRSFAVSTRLGLVMALLVAGERGYHLLGGGPEALVIIGVALIPVFAAARTLCGPLLPPIGRHWR